MLKFFRTCKSKGYLKALLMIIQKGLFMTFQNPVETPGISTTEIIRSSLEEKKGGFVPIDKVREKFTNTAQRLGENIWFFEREANVGFSGGEKKKNELIQALALKPRLLMLDELDSGLDLDSSDEISKILAEYQQETGCSYLIISHNLRVLRHLEISQAILLEKGHISKLCISIVNESELSQCSNASQPISSTLSGIITSFKFLHVAKAEYDIIFTLLNISTFVILLLPQKDFPPIFTIGFPFISLGIINSFSFPVYLLIIASPFATIYSKPFSSFTI